MIDRSDVLILAGYRPYRKTALAWAKVAEKDGKIETLEGTMTYSKGDYLCIGFANEEWAIKKEIFEATYVESPWSNG